MPSPETLEIVGDQGQKYSHLTGLVFIFNLIVGLGSLTIPQAFSQAGTVLGSIILLLLAFISLITVTFVIESMSLANCLLSRAKLAKRESSESINSIPRSRRERDPLIPPYLNERNAEDERNSSISASFEIKETVEMGKMASLFFSKIGIYLFYLCITVYLYGDLAIYIAAVAKSLRDTFCYYVPPPDNSTMEGIGNSSTIPDDQYCWSESNGIDRMGAYRIFSVAFLLLLGPFVFFNVQKTKHLQIATTLMRWLAFTIMIILASIRIHSGQGDGSPPISNIWALPNFFGVCVYSFMCHHSLPSLVTPIANKKRLNAMFTVDYALICGFYLLLALTGVYAFANIQDLYTLNFEPDKEDPTGHGIFTLMIQYFLSLFPVFTLSTNFPIIAITLRNNLKALFQVTDHEDDYQFTENDNGLSNSSGSSNGRGSRYNSCIRMCNFLLFPILAIAPPFLITIFVEDVQILVSLTGSYAGAGIQYLIPVFLVYYGRRMCSTKNNPYASPFKSVYWLYFVLIWAGASTILVTVYHITGGS